MRNIFINDYRRKAKQQTILDYTPNEYLLDNQQGAITNTAIVNLQLKEIQNEIHQLPAIFKRPFMLYFNGYKYNEIADMLNEPLGTIKSILVMNFNLFLGSKEILPTMLIILLITILFSLPKVWFIS